MNFTPTVAEKSAATRFARDGYFIGSPIIPPDLLARVRTSIAAVNAGHYETGLPPTRNLEPGPMPPAALAKIDNAHRSDRAILEVVSHPALGRLAAAITGAEMVQVFATQLLIKPSSTGGRVNVGWHQDQEYWNPALEGEVFTAWIAISDVTANSGPMRFVPGSHQWGLLAAGDFFGDDLDAIKQRIQQKSGGTWTETAAVLPPGAVSFHHRLTVHGSGPNLESWPRISFAVHLRTEKSALRPGTRWQDAGYLHDFNDPIGSPVCYRAS